MLRCAGWLTMKALRDNVGHNQYAKEENEDTFYLIVYFLFLVLAFVVAILSVIANISHENWDVIWSCMCIK